MLVQAFMVLVFVVVSFVVLLALYVILTYIPLSKVSQEVFKAEDDIELVLETICDIVEVNPDLFPQSAIDRCEEITKAR